MQVVVLADHTDHTAGTGGCLWVHLHDIACRSCASRHSQSACLNLFIIYYGLFYVLHRHKLPGMACLCGLMNFFQHCSGGGMLA